MNYKLIAHIVSILVVIISAFMLIPLGISLYFGESDATRAFSM